MSNDGELYTAARLFAKQCLLAGYPRDEVEKYFSGLIQAFPRHEDLWMEVLDCFGSWAPKEHRL